MTAIVASEDAGSIVSAKNGLADVVAAETELSYGDPDTGVFVVRGYDFREIADRLTFEEAVTLLWGDLTSDTCNPSTLGTARVAAFDRFAPLAPALRGLLPIDGQRFLVASLPDAGVRPVSLLAAVGVAGAIATAVWTRTALVPPDRMRGHAEDILRMSVGGSSTPEQVRLFESYLVTMIDSAVNASTFTARITASTRAGAIASVVAALCTLKGSLHGGAPSLVLDMLDRLACPEAATGFVEAELDRGARLPGFGSRAYRVPDPRGLFFRELLRECVSARGRCAVATAVEAAAEVAFARRSRRGLAPNVELYAAILLETVGIPRAGFAPAFAAGRAAGWIAHVHEQERRGRLIRPLTHYTGAWPEKAGVMREGE